MEWLLKEALCSVNQVKMRQKLYLASQADQAGFLLAKLVNLGVSALVLEEQERLEQVRANKRRLHLMIPTQILILIFLRLNQPHCRENRLKENLRKRKLLKRKFKKQREFVQTSRLPKKILAMQKRIKRRSDLASQSLIR
jgi:hypothetical protein